MKLCVMPSDWDGSGHYRCLHPAREMLRHGHGVVVAPHRKTLNERRQLRVVYGAVTAEGRTVPIDQAVAQLPFDLLVMQQRMDKGIAEWINGMDRPVVVDSDDAWFGLPAYNPGSRKPQEERGRMVAQLRAATAMTVSTPALAEMYEPFCDDITVIRNTLDWGMWCDAPQQSELDRRRVRVGYMGHADWHSGDLKVLAGVIGPWLERNPHVEFVACGDPLVHQHLGIPRRQRVSVAGTEFWHGDLPDITACFDIGLVPLAKNQMNECKSHLKGLEYAACGIPTIASPSESYKWFLDSGGGYLADKPAQWTRFLDELVNDDEYRREMGRAARAKAAEHTIQEHWTEWETIYERVCGKSDRTDRRDDDVRGQNIAA